MFCRPLCCVLTYAKSTLNDKVVGRTKRSTEWFTVCFLKSYELQFLNIFFC